MDELLKRRTVTVARDVINCCEDCGVSGEFTLPDYCPDIAVILKCMMYPCVQNRQWSTDQLLVDGVSPVRVLYLDEERCAVRSVEFSLPFSCTLRANSRAEMAPVELTLQSKYSNCRVLTPRRIEVRGAVSVSAIAQTSCEIPLVTAADIEGVYAKGYRAEVTYPAKTVEKIITVSESLEFPETLPPAEMLLGGECRVVVRECKLLTGKMIVKGQVYVHQLYTDDLDRHTTRCLDFVLPYSQIVDMNGVVEGMPYWATAQILSDTERCTVGPDGENTILDVSIKLLLQVQVYVQDEVEMLLDAYHTAYPLSKKMEAITIQSYCGCRWESSTLPMQITLPMGQVAEIIDVWVTAQDCEAKCSNGMAAITGRMLVSVLGRDTEGQIWYSECPEEYRIEYAADGNRAVADIVVTELRYRVVGDSMELQVSVCVGLRILCESTHEIISDVRLCEDTPYAHQKANALLYYAQANEDVWDIACRCHTSPDCIREENQLTADVLKQPTVLFVPILS